MLYFIIRPYLVYYSNTLKKARKSQPDTTHRGKVNQCDKQKYPNIGNMLVNATDVEIQPSLAHISVPSGN